MEATVRHLTSGAARLATTCVWILGAWAGHTQAAAATQIWEAVSDRTLDSQRGGFYFGGGLEVSFGITRSVFINGELITETVLNIASLVDITPAWAARLREELQSLTLVQNGPGNTFAAGVAPPASVSATPPSGSAPNSTSNSSSVSGPATSAPGVVSPTSATVTTVMAGTASGTVIQNTLNNQQIMHQTIINATSNGLSMLRLSTLHSTLSETIRQSVGVQ